ncbi:MAG: hypothetical protein OEW15_11680 [Nitrospirota bacterium]|nr:hypothetical protein [Nitrospirota bacterium]
MTSFLIPLVNIPQQFTIDLAGVTYTLVNKWNDISQGWILDILDGSQNPIVCGIPFVTGTDLLAGLEYLGINGELIVYTNGDQWAVPTLNNLGVDSNLYFQTDAVDG